MLRSIILFLLCVFFLSLNGQEVLTEIMHNPVIKSLQGRHLKSLPESDTLEIPVLDDFSDNSFLPNDDNWMDDFVYVNQTYPILPPTIGVATFDPFDETGNHYQEASFQDYIADYLTSHPVNLSYPASDSIYLSFFFQPGGYGNTPEEKDSLSLEFYDIENNQWNVVWNTEGFRSEEFFQVMIPIVDDRYLKKGFQFRFRSIVSFDGDIMSYFSNFDNWHLDYVYLDKNRNRADTVLHDVAFVETPRSVLNNYNAMPWGDHFKFGIVFEQGNMRYSFRNNDTIVRNTAYTYYLYEKTTGQYQKYDSAYLGQINLNPDSLLIKRYDVDADLFEPNPSEEGHFIVEYVIETDDFDYHKNDTVKYYQSFSNFYSYDDGSAENGYGVDAENAMVAYQFETYIEDTLQGVDMYFNHTLENASQQFFDLVVWNDNDGIPGNIIYEKAFQVDFGDRLNSFTTYEIDSSFAVNEVFYIGWRQKTSDFINLGFDRNRNNNDKIFYNLNGTWYNSSFEGSLMMRPLLGKDIGTGVRPIPEQHLDFTIYPNPANETVTILTDLTDDIRSHDFSVRIFDNLGRIVTRSSEKTINIHELPDGFYHLVLQFNGKIASKKLLIQK